MGKVLFYVLWPVLWMVAPLQLRVRVVIRRDEKLLVVKNWFGPGGWELPGGGIKLGETPERAAAREITEELSVKKDYTSYKNMHDGIRLVRKRGLLMRYKFVELTDVKGIEISSNWEITEWQWLSESSELAQRILLETK